MVYQPRASLLHREFRGDAILLVRLMEGKRRFGQSTVLISSELALELHFGWCIRIACNFNRNLPNERFDQARPGIVFTTIKQRDLGANRGWTRGHCFYRYAKWKLEIFRAACSLAFIYRQTLSLNGNPVTLRRHWIEMVACR